MLYIMALPRQESPDAEIDPSKDWAYSFWLVNYWLPVLSS
jgi:hypothetical protein